MVTGAAGRLGRLLVEAYVNRGATVAGVDREGTAIPLPDGAHAFHADLTDKDEVAACFSKIADDVGPIDGLVHAVGMWSMAPLHKTSLSDWRQMLDINLTSAFLCFREAIKQMRGSGGQVIGFASGQGADGGAAQQPAYSASKAGIIRLVESITAEYEDGDIRAHAIAPSMLLFGDEEDAEGVPAERIVDLACYLTDPAVSRATNGAVIRAYGSLR